MESASASTRHPRTLHGQNLVRAASTRTKRGLAGNQITSATRTSREPYTAQSLAERVYSWSIHDMDYRPDSNDTAARSHPRPKMHHDSHSNSEEFCPQALESLCDGPCATMFEYLVENIKSRSSIHSSRPTDEDLSWKTQIGKARRTESQAKAVRCRELVLAIAQKQREIAEAKERIKHQRQLQTIKEIHHQQSLHKARILQEYQSFFQRLRLGSEEAAPYSRDHNSARYTLETTLTRTAEEVARITRLVAVDEVQVRPDQATDIDGTQILHQQLQRSQDGAVCLLDIANGLKEKSLASLESWKQGYSQQQGVERNSEAAELLQLFREHHIERVVEIESILNQVAAYEREREELYTKMRFRAQKREQEKKPCPYLQELEESKARLKGLGATLEFIQAEQEIMVERVVSVDEQQDILESLSKASRAVYQKLVHLQRAVRKLIEMTRINQQDVPLTAGNISDEISHSFSEGLSQLSNLVQDPKYTMESDAMILKGLVEQSQQGYKKAHTLVLQPPALRAQGSGVMKFQKSGSSTWHEVMAAGSLSADQYILQLSALRRQVALQSLTVSRAKEWNERAARIKLETTSAMNAFLKTLPQDSQVRQSEDTDGRMSIDTLSSKFECDTKDVAHSIARFQDAHFTTFQTGVQQTIEHAGTATEIVQKIHSLNKDRQLILERLGTGDGSFKSANGLMDDHTQIV